MNKQWWILKWADVPWYEFETQIRWAHLIVHPVVRQVRDVGERISSTIEVAPSVSNRPHTDFSEVLYLKGTPVRLQLKGPAREKIINRGLRIEKKRTQSWQKQSYFWTIWWSFVNWWTHSKVQSIRGNLNDIKWSRIYCRIQTYLKVHSGRETPLYSCGKFNRAFRWSKNLFEARRLESPRFA